MPLRPVWAEVSRSRLLHNYRLLSKAAGSNAGPELSPDLLCVVKANAYGHGAVECARALTAEGAEWLGVTSAEEGAAVRAACPQARILVMNAPWGREAPLMVRERLTPVAWESFHLEELGEAARAANVRELPSHLEIDTGMARQGVSLERLPALLDKLRATPELRLEGVMTHFHSPEASAATVAQMAGFAAALEMVAHTGLRPEWIHAGNSTTILSGAELRSLEALTSAHNARVGAGAGARAMVRAGLALYGYALRPAETEPDGAGAGGLKPVLAWKTRIVSMRTIEPGQTAGYGATFRAARPTRIALLPVGYADGLNRLLSNRGEVLVRGRRTPIAGRISMDMTTVDVTDVPGVEIGDEVVLIGMGADGTGGARTGADADSITAYDITACDLADLAGTIPYEVLCNINTRVPRIMVD